MGLSKLRKGKSFSFTGISFKAQSSSSLKEGQEVEHEAGTGRGGRPEAAKVKPPSPKTE
jgi:hypothetical protein